MKLTKEHLELLAGRMAQARALELGRPVVAGPWAITTSQWTSGKGRQATCRTIINFEVTWLTPVEIQPGSLDLGRSVNLESDWELKKYLPELFGAQEI